MHANESLLRVCVIFGGGLGDAVLMLPSLAALREHFPCAHIEMVGNPTWIKLFEDRNYVDSTCSIDEIPLHIFFQTTPHTRHPLIEYLSNFDLIISWFGDQAGLFKRNIRRTVATRIFVFPFKNHAQYPGHVSDYYLSTLRMLGITPLSPRYLIFPPKRPGAMDDRRFRDTQTPHLHRICIHPGSGSPAKNWPFSRFVQVSREIVRRFEAQVAFLIGPADHAEALDLDMLGHLKSTAVLKDLSVSSLAVLLERSSLYIGNDSGPTHLAASTGIPTVALFGPTPSAKWSPRGLQVSILQKNLPCCPCDTETLRTCMTRRCLESITTEEVLKYVESVCLQTRGERAESSVRGQRSSTSL